MMGYRHVCYILMHLRGMLLIIGLYFLLAKLVHEDTTVLHFKSQPGHFFYYIQYLQFFVVISLTVSVSCKLPSSRILPAFCGQGRGQKLLTLCWGVS